MRTGSSRGTDRFRISAGSVAFDEPGFNDVDIGSAISEYGRTTPRIARPMFAHPTIIVNNADYRGRTWPYRNFRWAHRVTIFDSYRWSPHTLSAAFVHGASTVF
jgi:hypothetical protein